jgi:hypothetical protein
MLLAYFERWQPLCDRPVAELPEVCADAQLRANGASATLLLFANLTLIDTHSSSSPENGHVSTAFAPHRDLILFLPATEVIVGSGFTRVSEVSHGCRSRHFCSRHSFAAWCMTDGADSTRVWGDELIISRVADEKIVSNTGVSRGESPGRRHVRDRGRAVHGPWCQHPPAWAGTRGWG